MILEELESNSLQELSQDQYSVTKHERAQMNCLKPPMSFNVPLHEIIFLLTWYILQGGNVMVECGNSGHVQKGYCLMFLPSCDTSLWYYFVLILVIFYFSSLELCDDVIVPSLIIDPVIMEFSSVLNIAKNRKRSWCSLVWL